MTRFGRIQNSVIATYQRLKRWFYHETWALPVDIFRILAGILCIFYFSSLILEVDDFSSPDGLINHKWYLKTFWWLKINLIQPGIGTPPLFYTLLGLAIAGSAGIVIGYRTRLLAAVLFIIATSIQRWNFGVMYVDDGVMHLLLFWLILLPVGKTLVLGEWLREGKSCLPRWLHAKVPRFVVSCLIGNVCWIYFFAGITKLTSPLWREGLALYAVLLVPISRTPDFWGPEHLALLKFANYAALATEISLPFFLLSPKWSLRKWIGLILQVSFNLGIVLTLRIPFANIALLASPVLFFREEIMEAILRRYGVKGELGQSRRINVSSGSGVEMKGEESQGIAGSGVVVKGGGVQGSAIIALVFVLLVCMSTWRRVPILKHVGIPVTKALWTIGIAQDYRLFDWIDRMNYHVNQEILFYPSDGTAPEKINPTDILPRTVRHSLVQARIYDIYWLLHIPDGSKGELERDTRRRVKSRACRKVKEDGRLVIKTTIHHVTPDNVGLRKKPRTDVMRLRCLDGGVAPLRTRVIQ